MKIFQKGFNYSQDGPGNRLVIHMQGCNMHCPWCSNPEGMAPEGELMTDAAWLSESLCPHGAIEGKVLSRTVCESCVGKECVLKMHSKGLHWSCEELSTDEVLLEILSSKMMFYDGGGVTFTGGECTLQFNELKALLTELKKNKINTAIESNASHPLLPELFPLLDHLILDCKIFNSIEHLKILGIPNEIILKNIRLAAEAHPSVHIRVPLIGGVNDGEDEQSEMTLFFKSLPQEHVSFEVLRYHEYGVKKWQECGLDYKMDEGAKVTAEAVQKFITRLEDAGLKYKKT